jgi:thymidylate synthase (FAD)
MPENKNLKPTKFPMKLRFGEKPQTLFFNCLEKIHVTIKEAPTMEELRKYVVDFATATWEDNPVMTSNKMYKMELDHLIYMIFKGKLYPGALETIKVTFLLEGISYQDVSHILRYRLATFSAECSADKWWSHKNVVVPTSIENSPQFYDRFVKLHKDMKQLYCDMIDSKEISLIDARYVLTRACETYYWVSMDLATALKFIRDRIDKQIQPQSDNVIAYRMFEELLAYYPLLADVIDIHAPAMFYVNTARTGRCTNLFVPDKDSDIYEWNREDYLYQRERSEVNGTSKTLSKQRKIFEKILAEVDEYITNVKGYTHSIYPIDFFEV